MELGEMISLRRKQAKLTIDELVLKSGVAKGTLNKIIGGITKDPGLETVKAIAHALNCTLDDLDDDLPKKSDHHTVSLTNHEFTVIQAYKAQPEMQSPVDKLLGIESASQDENPQNKEEMIRVWAAAMSNPKAGNGYQGAGFIEIPKTLADRILNTKDTDEDL